MDGALARHEAEPTREPQHEPQRFGPQFEKGTNNAGGRTLEHTAELPKLSARELLNNRPRLAQALRDFQAGNQSVRERGWSTVAVREFMRQAVDTTDPIARNEVEYLIPGVVRNDLGEIFSIN